MGQMKRQAMINEENFWEIAQEYRYIAEDWDDFRDHMINQSDLVIHLDIDLEEELADLWYNQ
jgi:hypothetical protein